MSVTIESLLFFIRLMLSEACNTEVRGPKNEYMIHPEIVDLSLKSPKEPVVAEDYFPEYLKNRPWTYDRQGSWGCSGKRQSPIDIVESKTKMDIEEEFIKNGPLNFTNYETLMPAIGFNNGNTVQFISMSKNFTELRVTGGPLESTYRLEQIHYHIPSEHSIEGRKHTMEIHLVHIRDDLEVDAALTKSDGLAILAVFCKVIPGWQKPWLNDIDSFSELKIPGNTADVKLNVSKMLPKNLDSYYTYAGSLTTPKCQEVVTWIVFETPVAVPENLIRDIATVGVSANNFRSTQPWNEHKVYRTPQTKLLTPLLYEILKKPVEISPGLYLPPQWRNNNEWHNWLEKLGSVYYGHWF